jgi:hypothetical protein
MCSLSSFVISPVPYLNLYDSDISPRPYLNLYDRVTALVD